jgi:hypothetical protein
MDRGQNPESFAAHGALPARGEVAFPERKRPMPSLKEQLLLYVKRLKKREASKKMPNDSAYDRFRIEGMNFAYGKIVRELEALLSGKELPAP